MRHLNVSVVVAVQLTAVLCIPANASFRTTSPSTVLLEKARAAIGGATRLGSVTSLKLVGTFDDRNLFYGQSRAAVNEFTRNSLEVRAMFPEHYLTIRQADEPVAATVRNGFSGTVLLNRTVVAGQVGEWSGPDAMRVQRFEFARLAVLLLLRTDTALRLEVASESDSRITLSGPEEFRCVIQLDPKSFMPAALSFPVRMVQSGELRQYVTTVDERRTVNGISFPVRVTTTAVGKTFSRAAYDTIEVNPNLTLGFEK